MKKPDTVVHQNYITNNKIYCRKQNKVIKPDYDLCWKCNYLDGSLQGKGVECRWDDMVEDFFWRVHNPKEELERVTKLIEMKIIK